MVPGGKPIGAPWRGTHRTTAPLRLTRAASAAAARCQQPLAWMPWPAGWTRRARPAPPMPTCSTARRTAGSARLGTPPGARSPTGPTRTCTPAKFAAAVAVVSPAAAAAAAEREGLRTRAWRGRGVTRGVSRLTRCTAARHPLPTAAVASHVAASASATRTQSMPAGRSPWPTSPARPVSIAPHGPAWLPLHAPLPLPPPTPLHLPLPLPLPLPPPITLALPVLLYPYRYLPLPPPYSGTASTFGSSFLRRHRPSSTSSSSYYSVPCTRPSPWSRRRRRAAPASPLSWVPPAAASPRGCHRRRRRRRASYWCSRHSRA